MKIWIDDIRPAPDDSYYHVYSVNDAIEFIQMNWNNIEEISLDHDAGSFVCDGGDYIKILDWIEFVLFEGKEVPFKFNLHSMNPVGVQNMRAIIQHNGWMEV